MVTTLLALFLAGCGVQSIPRAKNGVEAAFAEIQNQYQRRADLVPNLVATVKGVAAHERQTLTAVVEARGKALAAQIDISNLSNLNDANLQKLQQAQGALSGALSKLLLLTENYPQLKADQHFLKLQGELINTENRIQAARRFYNGNVRDYRNKCESFPSNLVAGMFNFQPHEFFSVPPAMKEVPNVDFGSA